MKSTIRLESVEEFLRVNGPTSVQEVMDEFDASNRASKRALNYLVHKGRAERSDTTGLYSYG